nr:capsular biosynthesis protein [Cryobacterium roopkundense]
MQELGTQFRAVPLGEGFELPAASVAVSGATRLIHLAGINRGSEDDVAEGNVLFARQAADALLRADDPPPVVVFANSTQSGTGSVYGEAKARAAEVLTLAAEHVGARFENLHLPNLFGEHGRPHYNSVAATFCHQLVHGLTPTVQFNRELTLLHAQHAADVLIGSITHEEARGWQVHESVRTLLSQLVDMSALYAAGEIPDLADPFHRDLFNTYRSYTVGLQTPLAHTRQADARGTFTEIVRTHGGPGQYSVSTTVPGVSRGDHFHRRKVERFTVIYGEAVIALRRLFTEQVVEFAVSGDDPVSVDMPTMWAHSIRNTGSDLLFTSFWTNEPYDPQRPDTSTEKVQP